ncbi:MAG: hypothetical protein ACLTF5_08520 [Butyricicoccus sp.]
MSITALAHIGMERMVDGAARDAIKIAFAGTDFCARPRHLTRPHFQVHRRRQAEKVRLNKLGGADGSVPLAPRQRKELAAVS